ncbi:hypothetical protein ZOD2009_15626 [Haladaptatus paucihalophilus DX253]|uniref:Uncharacterized protein n=1 Tax=Haladaptatus paucihalophilus DX253 TaxID=797209 RepID=E7QWD7_HALPU|nr:MULTISPECIES: hypothetical protein [Haladaptatus]EFW91033.1 hypothetical protein ZOD2009_15626 [Haladaptatus paucihalophilus DX253]GKZ15399.1 hypothetical protein HAL_32800 [Haladaptatus sp. T7]SHL39201.1 hypothetical protein SAMN05444342_3757 [Haladaptatus paucihalophilus DX253]
MTDSHGELLQQVNEMQAASGIDPDTRKVIGILSETINTLGTEIEELQQRVAELEEGIEKNGRSLDDEQKQAWYSER